MTIWFWQPYRKLTKVISSIEILQLKNKKREEDLAKQLMKLQAHFSLSQTLFNILILQEMAQ